MRDMVMSAVRSKIARDRLRCDQVIISGRPMLTKYRERILRGEFENISLRRSILIADAVGVQIDLQVAA
ncbi:hypothetical protein [Devosia pacifica]|nr:hypothetical protein [Devosia pacifica]